jgi:uncharacterized membrane protein YeaQ/YmgE (transglycosylase-associated protein family)
MALPLLSTLPAIMPIQLLQIDLDNDVARVIIFLLIGLAAGWLANYMLEAGLDLLGSLIVGVVGALIGGYLFRVVGIDIGGLVGELIVAIVGAVLLLGAARVIRKAS